MDTFAPFSFEKIRRIQITALHKVNSLFAGSYRSAFKGRGMEFEEVREYFPGDDIRSIDWNVTARHQKAFVKNFREERELTLMLVVDVSASLEFGHNKQSKRDLIAEMGALLAFAALKNSDKVGLILFSNQIELYLRPKKGLKHVLRVIRELLYFKPKTQGTNLSCALHFLSVVEKKKTLAFLMSDFLTSDFRKEAEIVAKKHELSIFHVQDRREEVFYPFGLLTLQDLETGQLRVVDTANPEVRKTFSNNSRKQRKEVQSFFASLKTRYMTINTEESAEKALIRFFRLKKGEHEKS